MTIPRHRAALFVGFSLGLMMLAAPVFGASGEASYDEQRKPHVVPENGFVPTEAVAIQIAEAILPPIYGKKLIESERPFRAELHGGVWHVHGSLPAGARLGGVAEVEINKADGKILRAIHSQ